MNVVNSTFSSRQAVYLICLLLSVVLTGCRTYFGYNDIYEDKVIKTERYNRDDRDFAVLEVTDGKAQLSCFRKYDLHIDENIERKIVGRRHFYSRFRGDFYFDKFFNPWSQYKSLTGKWLDSGMLVRGIINDSEVRSFAKQHGYVKREYNASSGQYIEVVDEENSEVCAYRKSVESQPNKRTNYFYYLMPIAGQLVFCIDMSVLAGAMTLDCCWGVCCWTWTGISVPSYWFGSRTFKGWDGNDWRLAEHAPNPLTLFSYLPVVSWFFPFQTPPYMATGRYSEEERDASLEKISDFIISKEVIAQQQAYGFCLISVAICGKNNDEVYAKSEFHTDGNGRADLSALIREAVEKAPLACNDFKMSVALYRPDGTLIAEKISKFNANQVVLQSSRQDDLAYRSRTDVDYLNRMIWRLRSCRAMRKSLIDTDLISQQILMTK